MTSPLYPLGWLDPQELWQVDPFTLPTFESYDASRPDSRIHGQSTLLYDFSSNLDSFRLEKKLPEDEPDKVSYVNPRDVFLSTDHSTARSVTNLSSDQELHRSLETRVETGNKRQRRSRLPQEATARFKDWYLEHQDYPYPSPESLASLAQVTNTTIKQVKSWFSNARTRQKHASIHETSSGVDVPARSGLTTSALETFSRCSGSPRSMESVKRYLDLPLPGDEISCPESVHGSANVLPSLELLDGTANTEELPPWLSDAAEHSQNTAPSVSGSDHYSVFSGVSLASMGSALSGWTSYTSASASGGSRRRGKRRFDRMDSDTSFTGKKFPCTFCAKSFASSYDWKRHETTHLSFVAQWVCMPDNVAIDEDGECLFCFAPDVDGAHLHSHSVAACRQKPLEERKFGRKDQLKQHIEICHLTKAQAADSHMLNKFLDHWHREVELSWRNDEHKDALWCGFCCTHSHSWKQRQDHVAEHLRSGFALNKWRSYRRFITYCEEHWDDRHAGTFSKYSDYVDHLIAKLKAEAS